MKMTLIDCAIVFSVANVVLAGAFQTPLPEPCPYSENMCAQLTNDKFLPDDLKKSVPVDNK